MQNYLTGKTNPKTKYKVLIPDNQPFSVVREYCLGIVSKRIEYINGLCLSLSINRKPHSETTKRHKVTE